MRTYCLNIHIKSRNVKIYILCFHDFSARFPADLFFESLLNTVAGKAFSVPNSREMASAVITHPLAPVGFR